MKRRVYVICQKKEWTKGVPQVISDGAGEIDFIGAGQEGLRKGKILVKKMNKDKGLHPVHLRKATLVIEEEIKHDAQQKDDE